MITPDQLRNLVKKLPKDVHREDFHSEFKNIQNENPNKDFSECYSLLRNRIYERRSEPFQEQYKNFRAQSIAQPFTDMCIEELLELKADEMIGNLYRIFWNYDPEESAEIIVTALEAMVFDRAKSKKSKGINKEQENLLRTVEGSEEFFATSPIDVGGTKVLLRLSPNPQSKNYWNMVLSEIQSDLRRFLRRNFDLIFPLYLLGGENTSPITYVNLLRGKTGAQRKYDDFILWLWQWAQKKKPSQRVPDDLKKVCAEILRLVSPNNNGTSDLAMYHVNEAALWDHFKNSVTNARKRLRRRTLVALLHTLSKLEKMKEEREKTTAKKNRVNPS